MRVTVLPCATEGLLCPQRGDTAKKDSEKSQCNSKFTLCCHQLCERFQCWANAGSEGHGEIMMQGKMKFFAMNVAVGRWRLWHPLCGVCLKIKRGEKQCGDHMWI